MAELPVACDVDLNLTGVRSRRLGTYLNAAAVAWSLQREDTSELGSGTADYVAASDGNYYGIIDAVVTALMTAGIFYYLVVTVVEGNYNDRRRIRMKAVDRTLS